MVLLEGAQVQLVGAGDEHAVEWQVGEGQRDLAALDRQEQILPGVEGPLEQVAVLDDASRSVDELAKGLEEGQGAQRRGQRTEAAVAGDLPLARVHRHLRPDGDGALAILP